MSLRKLAFLVVLLAAPAARADVGIGLFLGQPTGLDLKFGTSNRAGLDIVLGFHDCCNQHDGGDYAHVTYLVTPFVGRGNSVLVPFRVGIGLALLDDGRSVGDNLHAGVRAPLELGLRFRSVPLEIYGEISALLVFQHDPYLDLDGGIGLRLYF
jgi:hypothetical protein